jgi:hypothetical protein
MCRDMADLVEVCAQQEVVGVQELDIFGVFFGVVAVEIVAIVVDQSAIVTTIEAMTTWA